MNPTPWLAFCPHPALRGGHRQTLAGVYWPSYQRPPAAEIHVVDLPDGDRLFLHENRPWTEQPGEPCAILLHGLCGCHESPYMRRIAVRLLQQGIRTFRMDQRGWGSGKGHARQAMHAGRSDDLRHAVEYVEKKCPNASLVLVGFSLGGNVVLKLMAEYQMKIPAFVRGAIAVSPPMDLAACARQLQVGWARWYERYFLHQLIHHVRHQTNPTDAWRSCLHDLSRVKTLRDFDHYFTARLGGFASAEDYYARCSTWHRLNQIHATTHILAAQDDPLVPGFQARLKELPCSDHVRLHLPQQGGHLGFVAQRQSGFDGRWMDWQVTRWTSELLLIRHLY